MVRTEHNARDSVTGQNRPATPSTVRVFSLSERETLELGQTFAQQLRGGDIVALSGDLGLGKTVFVRGIATGLGADPDDVRSPSFTLVETYLGGRLPLHHADLYRLGDGDELEALGLEESLATGGVVLVEWGDRLPAYFLRDAIIVQFFDIGEDARRIEIEPRAARESARGGSRDDTRRTGRGDA